MTKETAFSSYSPVEYLVQTARAALQLLERVSIPGVEITRPSLRRALAHIDEVTAEREGRYRSHIDKARKRYAEPSSDDVEIDDVPLISSTEDGCWVSGWMWIRNEEQVGGHG